MALTPGSPFYGSIAHSGRSLAYGTVAISAGQLDDINAQAFAPVVIMQAAPVANQTPTVVQAKGSTPLGVGRITLTTATAKTLADVLNLAGAAWGVSPATIRYVIIKVSAQAIRYADDGQTPTAANGYPYAVGTEWLYDGTNMAALRFIEQVSGAVLDIAAYG